MSSLAIPIIQGRNRLPGHFDSAERFRGGSREHTSIILGHRRGGSRTNAVCVEYSRKRRLADLFRRLPLSIAAAALGAMTIPYRVIFSANSSAQVYQELNTSDNFGLIAFL